MREKELRLALICYGGISLAVYMHGITKEVWRLAAASQRRNSDHQADAAGGPPADVPDGSAPNVYHRLLDAIAEECGIGMHVFADILAGASAGGINAIFLAQAISTGQSLDPLTELWLENADVDRLVDPGVNPVSRMAKRAAVPFAWALSLRRSGEALKSVEPAHREEVRAKLANLVRARWFAPPFSGPGFTELLLDALDAMAAGPKGPPLLPPYQPLDLFVTVTDFNGYPERLRLNTPAEVVEREHRIILSFRDSGGEERRLADPAELAFAARATASFPGAFPPFQVTELDGVLAAREQEWPDRGDFLSRAFPRRAAIGEAETIILIDGSVLANAPFRPAIGALKNRGVRREVDRRFVYIDPKPGLHSVKLGPESGDEAPGFFATIFAALSDIPRQQPIRDNLEAIDSRSSHIRRLSQIMEAMRPEVEAAIERAFGRTLLLGRPTPQRLAAWRAKAQAVAAREAGYAYAAHGHLKIAAITEEVAAQIARLGGERLSKDVASRAVWNVVREDALGQMGAISAEGASPAVILFLRKFDLSFRVRRLRFLARRLREFDERPEVARPALEEARGAIYSLISLYAAAPGEPGEAVFAAADVDCARAMDALAERLDLRRLDDQADAILCGVLAAFPKAERRTLILSYLGFPFYDIATFALLQGEGLDEFDPVKVDRISPDDCTAIRPGGAKAMLKGIQFNNFGAFFSRAYRENDYLWGRLHGADRLIDILVSTLPEGKHLPAGMAAALKRDAFRAILAEEKPRLARISALFEALEKEIG